MIYDAFFYDGSEESALTLINKYYVLQAEISDDNPLHWTGNLIGEMPGKTVIIPPRSWVVTTTTNYKMVLSEAGYTSLAIDECKTLINLERGKKKLPLLSAHPKLNNAAQSHSNDMAKRKKMSHSGGDGSTPFQRIKAAGYNYTTAGECVGWNYPTPKAIVDGWMGDIPHRRILLGKSYTHVGIGMQSLYWTADFAAGEKDNVFDFDLW